MNERTMLKLEVLKQWNDRHGLHLFVPDKHSDDVLNTGWLSYCNYSYGAYHIEDIPEEIEVLQKIERFEFNDVHLKTLPNSLCKIHSMTEFFLARNDIETLPSCIGELKNLAYLDVSDNAISKLPESIGDLQELVMLSISNNRITNLPASIGKLKKLDRLFLVNNPIGRLPESLQECSSLETLDISGTNITNPPKWLEEMPSLKKVIGAPELILHFQKHLQDNEYGQMQIKFRELFNRDLTEEEIAHKKGGMIGDEALPLGRYVWDKRGEYIEYYVSWLPHYRGDSHGKIYKDGRHESLPTLPQIGEVTQRELDLKEELRMKGLYDVY